MGGIPGREKKGDADCAHGNVLRDLDHCVVSSWGAFFLGLAATDGRGFPVQHSSLGNALGVLSSQGPRRQRRAWRNVGTS